MTTAYDRKIRRERRRRRDEKIAHTIAPIKAVAKFFFVMVATLVFGAVLVGVAETNVRRTLDIIYFVAMFFFALWCFAKVFNKE